MEGSSDLAFAGAARQAQVVRAGEVSSRELVELYLERIGRLDPELNAYRLVLADRALAEADAADARRAAGEQAPLLGVPVAIKDSFDVEGEVTTHGTGAYGPPAAADSEVVRRLRGAGAVILGKTNLPELAIMGTTESPTWGVTRNPWNPDRTPGGSSGGAAAAVAAGLVAAAQASDGAGSIRIPAAHCNLFGLKPQRGRVSLMPAAQHWNGMTAVGALTRSVIDTAIFLDAVAGAAPGDAHAAPAPARPFAESARRSPGRLRVAVSFRAAAPSSLHPEVRRALEELAALLGSLGHEVERRDPSYNEVALAIVPRYLKGIQEDAEAVPRPGRLQRRTRGFAALGRAVPDFALRLALRDEARHAARINRVFEDHDVLLTPVAARPPVDAAEWEGRGGLRTLVEMGIVHPYTILWNVTGQPAASVPAGFTGDGLPIGAQLVGRTNDEGTLLSLAAQIEAERPWAGRRPPVS